MLSENKDDEELPFTKLFLFPLSCFSLQVEALLASEDYGKDLASVNNLLKKHQLLEADISAHEVMYPPSTYLTVKLQPPPSWD